MLQRRYLWAAAFVMSFLSPGTVRAADEPKPVKVAHIKLSGDLDEAPVSADPIFGLGGENFKTKLDRIKKARDDKDIAALYLQLDGLSVGWGKLDELRKAVADFRKSGKKVYAFLEAGEPADYLLALACDEVCIPQSGTLMLVGLRAEMTFYKKLLDNLSLKADVLQMGDFKGAAEPFVRTDPSPEVKQNLESVLDDFFDNQIVKPIVESRAAKKWTPEQVKKLIDQGPFTAKKALELGLIDRVAYSTGLRDSIKEQLKADKLTVVSNYGQAKADDLETNPFALMMKLLKPPTASSSTKPKVAVIYAVGAITTGKGGQGMFGGNIVGSTDMIQAIRQAEQDKTVKCIVLRVDSPGGSALASDLIWNELKRCQKPIVASMSDVAASGGYYISMPAQKIYAEPGTITGSIGVFGMKLVTGDLESRVGITSTTLTRGANAGILSSSRPYNDSERKAMKEVISDIYDQFLDKAVEGRKQAGQTLTRAQLEKLAGGRIWTGRQAKANGLVDELGTLEDAIAAAKKLSKHEGDLEILSLPKPKSFLDSLLERQEEGSAVSLTLMKELALLREFPAARQHLPALEAVLRTQGGHQVWALMPGVRIK